MGIVEMVENTGGTAKPVRSCSSPSQKGAVMNHPALQEMLNRVDRPFRPFRPAGHGPSRGRCDCGWLNTADTDEAWCVHVCEEVAATT